VRFVRGLHLIGVPSMRRSRWAVPDPELPFKNTSDETAANRQPHFCVSGDTPDWAEPSYRTNQKGRVSVHGPKSDAPPNGDLSSDSRLSIRVWDR
jgi:hypothetical protein